MAKIQQSPKLPRETRREQLLASARKLFVKKGFRATTTEEIARHAGLTKGAIYHHFESKEDIFLQLMKSIFGRHRAAMRRELEGAVDPVGAFKLGLRLQCHCGADEFGDIVDLWIQGWRVPRIKRYITQHIRRELKRFADRIGEPNMPGVTQRDVSVFLFALVDGVSTLRMVTPSVVDLDAQVSLVESLFGGKGGRIGKEERR